MGGLLSKRSSLLKSPSNSSLSKKLAVVSPLEAVKRDFASSVSSLQHSKCDEEKCEKFLQAVSIRNGLQIPMFETNIRIIAVSNETGLKHSVPIIPSSDPQKFFALFNEDNVDFEIQVDNLASPQREVGLRLNVHNLKKKFVIDRASVGNLRTFESNGKKFHFLRQSSEDGQIFVGTFAQKNGISFHDASIIVSQLKFSVEYSEPLVTEETPSDLIKVQVMQMNGQPLEVSMSRRGTIEDLKRKLQGLIEIPKEGQKLIFGGKILQDERSLEEYRIHENSTIYVVEKVRGGGASLIVPSLRNYVKDFDLMNEQTVRYESANDIGEIGTIAFGEDSNQCFCSASFDADENIFVNDFVIELRMKSKYAFAN